jgi:hypothetical protein
LTSIIPLLDANADALPPKPPIPLPTSIPKPTYAADDRIRSNASADHIPLFISFPTVSYDAFH